MTTRILIIEDDRQLSRILQLELQHVGYEALTAFNGLEGLRLFHDLRPELLILDVALPLMDGMTVCKRVRDFSDVPILMMTAHAITEQDIAAGLDAGADEFLIKPIRPVEFQARVKALLRRYHGQQKTAEEDDIQSYEDEYLSVDLNGRHVLVKGKDMRLTPTEYRLLEMFIKRQGQVLTFQQILEHVWGFEYHNEYHYPRIYVSHLRHKIEPDYRMPTYIHNEYGIGYRFVSQINIET